MSEASAMRRGGMVLIPAYNEAATLPAVLDGLRALALDLEIVVVDDGSDDETGAVARDRGAYVIRHPMNLNYGSALQTGYKYALRAGHAFVVQMDADGQHPASEVPKLVDPLLAGEGDLVVGSRFAEPESYRMEPLKRLGSSMFRSLGRLSGLDLSDPTSGFQALGRRVLEIYAEDFFPVDFPDIDVLIIAHRSGLRVVERPVKMLAAPRESSLHSGLRPFYYVYRTLLAMWVASGVRSV